MKVTKRCLMASVGMFAALSCTLAHAQTTERGSNVVSDLNLNGEAQSNFKRDRNVSVVERPHPGYEAVGVREGAFMVWPKIQVTAEYNDNIFATPTAAASDTIFHIQPELDVTSNWSRHSIEIYARAVTNEFASHSDQNTNDYAVGGRGRLDILRSANATGGIEFARLTEPRTSTASEGQPFPVQYRLATGYLAGAREVNRLRLSGRLDWQRFDYIDRVGNFPQEDRDRSLTTITGRADYAVSPDTALFIQVAGNNRDYRLSSSPILISIPEFPNFVNRDSSGVEVLAGANFELAALIRGEIGVGYLKQDFKDSNLSDITGLGARGQIEWFPTQLTTVTLNVARTVEDAPLVGASSYLANNVGLRVDHELLRNVLLNAHATYGKNDYRGVDRHDQQYGAGLGATYLMNRSLGLSLAYDRTKQEARGTDPSVQIGNFTVDRVSLTLALQY